MISSLQNARVKYIASLQERKRRMEEGVCWAESRRCVAVALASGWRVREVVVSAGAGEEARGLAARAAAEGCRVHEFSEACFRKVSVLRHSDGIGAVVETRVKRGVPEAGSGRVVVAWSLQDPGNLGGIIRTAAGMNCRRIVTVEPCVDAVHPLAIRASAGMVFLMEMWQAGEEEVRSWLAGRATESAALSPRGGEALSDASANPPRILIAGNEARGVPDELAGMVRRISIPMAPDVESLNVNAAAAIACYALWGREEA